MVLTELHIWSNDFDNAISIWFSQIFESLPHFLKDIVIAFSTLGDYAIFFGLLGIILLMFKRTRKTGFQFIGTVVITLVFVNLVFKNIFDRARPFQDPELLSQLISIQNNNGIVYGLAPSSSSFPSGHTFTAFCIVGTFIFSYLFDKENRKYNKKLLIFFTIYAFIMGLCRILLSHHYATDVIAGLLLGLVFGIGNYYLVELGYKLKDKYSAKKEQKEENN